MKKISAKAVIDELVLGKMGVCPPDYLTKLESIKGLSIKEKMKLSNQEKFPKTWHELFEDDDTVWYESKLPFSTDFVNLILDSGKGFLTRIGLRHSELIKRYKDRSMDKEDKQSIDCIRKSLNPHPRIIVLTRDLKEFVIFDGAHRAVAFMLEKKSIPVFIGHQASFHSLIHLR